MSEFKPLTDHDIARVENLIDRELLGISNISGDYCVVDEDHRTVLIATRFKGIITPERLEVAGLSPGVSPRLRETCERWLHRDTARRLRGLADAADRPAPAIDHIHPNAAEGDG